MGQGVRQTKARVKRRRRPAKLSTGSARPLLCRLCRGTLEPLQENTMPIAARRQNSNARRLVAAPVLASFLLGLTILGGCSTHTSTDDLPGLGEVMPTGPKGKKCFDVCAHAHVACDEMCPASIGICQEECTVESKECLVDCPELQRPAPKTPWNCGARKRW